MPAEARVESHRAQAAQPAAHWQRHRLVQPWVFLLSTHNRHDGSLVVALRHDVLLGFRRDMCVLIQRVTLRGSWPVLAVQRIRPRLPSECIDVLFACCVAPAVEVSEAKECEVCEKVVEDIRKAVFKKLPSESC